MPMRKDSISERHRHRYEFNNQYRDTLSEKGLRIAGTNPERDLVEIVEILTTHGLLQYNSTLSSNLSPMQPTHCSLTLLPRP